MASTHLDQSANHAQACEAKILKWPIFARGVEERVEKEWDMSCTPGSVMSRVQGI